LVCFGFPLYLYLNVCLTLPDIDIHIEKELLSNIAKGDENAFAQLYFHYKDRIYAISVKLCGSVEVGEDMVQEVFLKIWINRDKLLGIEHFRAYLYTIARNHVIRYLKKLALNMEGLNGEMDSVIRSNSETNLIEKEYQKTLQEAIKSLSSQQAIVYRLSREEGLKREEIAAQMGISPETVKTHLAQALKHIRAFCLARLDLLLLLIYLKK